MRYRLIAFDIDGTLRDTDDPMSQRTLRAVDMVRAAGAAVTLATGRTYEDALPTAHELGVTSPIISSQGAHIADPGTGESLWHRPLEPEMAAAALDALNSSGLELLSFHPGVIYATELTRRLDFFIENRRVEVTLVDDLAEVVSRGPTRLVAVGEEAKVDRLESRLKDQFDSKLYITRSVPTYCEVLHPGVGKDRALAWLCRRLGVSQEETVAFGNGYNDVEMIGWAGLGVAVGEAVPGVLATADRRARPVEEDGTAQVLEELVDDGLIG